MRRIRASISKWVTALLLTEFFKTIIILVIIIIISIHKNFSAFCSFRNVAIYNA